MIVARIPLCTLEQKDSPLWWHEKGRSYTTSGYGSKIPTPTMVRLPGSARWRRVYCCVWSNIGTCYVEAKSTSIHPEGDGRARRDWIVLF